MIRMRNGRPALAFLIFTLGCALHAATSAAAPITLDVTKVGSEPGFAFSYIHDASNSCSAEGFCMAGDRLFRLDGDITGDLDASTGVLALDGGVVLEAIATQGGADAIAGVTRLDRWDFRIDGGSLELAPANPLNDPGAAVADAQGRAIISGTVAYTLIDDNGVTRDSGAFYFFPRDFSAANSPNTHDQGVLSLWGNNWDNLADPGLTGLDPNGIGPLGVDIQAKGEVIPEPSAYLLYAMGAGCVGLVLRRKAGA